MILTFVEERKKLDVMVKPEQRIMDVYQRLLEAGFFSPLRDESIFYAEKGICEPYAYLLAGRDLCRGHSNVWGVLRSRGKAGEGRNEDSDTEV